MIRVTFLKTQGQKSKNRRQRYTVIFKSPEMRFKYDICRIYVDFHQLLKPTVSSRKNANEREPGSYASGLLEFQQVWKSMRDY